MSKYEKEIKTALENIFMFTGTDLKYVQYAQLQSYLEWLLINCGVSDA